MPSVDEQIESTLQRIQADLALLQSQRQEAKAQYGKFPTNLFPPTQYNLIGDTGCGFADLVEAGPQSMRLHACQGFWGKESDCIASCSQPATDKKFIAPRGNAADLAGWQPALPASTDQWRISCPIAFPSN